MWRIKTNARFGQAIVNTTTKQYRAQPAIGRPNSTELHASLSLPSFRAHPSSSILALSRPCRCFHSHGISSLSSASSPAPSTSSPSSSSLFVGHTFCLTGKFSSRTKSSLEQLIQQHGGNVAQSLNKSCTHLIANAMGSSKTKKASEQFNIDIVTEDWVNESLRAGHIPQEQQYYLHRKIGGPTLPVASNAPSVPSEVVERAKMLREEIQRVNAIYYGSGEDTGLTDAQFDTKFRELQKIESTYPSLLDPSSPTQSPGSSPLPQSSPSSNSTAAPHYLPMLSLQSCTDVAKVRKWDTSLKKLLKLSPSTPLTYHLELKYDGIAVSLLYRSNRLVGVRTRGSGTIGEDIMMASKRWVKNIPLQLDQLPKESRFRKEWESFMDHSPSASDAAASSDTLVEVRGEILLTTSSHSSWIVWHRQHTPDDPSLATLAQSPPRNLCAGLLRRDLELAIHQPTNETQQQPPSPLTFVAYSIHVHHHNVRHASKYLIQPPQSSATSTLDGSQPAVFPATQAQSIELLAQLGLPTAIELNNEQSALDPSRSPPSFIQCDGIDAAVDSLRTWTAERDRLDFAIDGIVLKVNDLSLSASLGTTSHHPRGALAFKFPAKTASTVLVGIDWQIGREGKVVPVANLEPVTIDGVSVKRASLHNCAVLEELQLKIGDTVAIERRGDVIPYIAGKCSSSTSSTNAASAITLPTHCICSQQSRLESRPSTTDPDRFDLYCTSATCPIQSHMRIDHYCSSACMDIVGLGPASLEELRTKGLVSSIEDVITLPHHRQRMLDMVAKGELPGWGEKRINSICDNILRAHANATPYQLLVSTGVPRLGSSLAKTLLERFGSIDRLLKATKEDLEGIPSLGPKLIPHLIFEFHRLTHGLVKTWHAIGIATNGEPNQVQLETIASSTDSSTKKKARTKKSTK